MPLLVSLPLLLALVPAPLRPRAPEDPSALPAVRVEHFALEEFRAGEARLHALCELKFLERGPERVLQLDLRFAAGPRVVHVESRDAQGVRMVWRELGARGGRTLLVDWAARTNRLGVGWRGLDGRTRGEWFACTGATLPLSLVELGRHGQALAGRLERLEPLAGALEPVDLSTSYALLERGPAGAIVERTLELWREDGSSAGRWVFRGLELVRFQLQEGGPWARRIEGEEHARRLSELASAAKTEG